MYTLQYSHIVTDIRTLIVIVTAISTSIYFINRSDKIFGIDIEMISQILITILDIAWFYDKLILKT